jgi:hypothetical protein
VRVRIIEEVVTIAADRSLRRVLDAMPMDSKRVGRMSLLYAFLDPSRSDTTIARNALDAFVPALAQTVQKNDGEHSTAIDTDLSLCDICLGEVSF